MMTMKKYLVLYYSNSGNSKFIAEKLSNELSSDLRRIHPLIDNVLLLFLLSSLRISIPTNISKQDILKYDEIILLGPIWGGLIVSPLNTVLALCIESSKLIHFAVTCESGDEKKNSKYGYSQVLEKACELGGKYVNCTEAFSTSLVTSGGNITNPKPLEKVKITEKNYKGRIMSRVQNFAKKIKASA